MTTNDHPLSEARAAELWDAHRDPGVFPFHAQGRLYVRSQTAMLRAAFDAGREHEREHDGPRYDLRPWQDCTREDICAGDLVEARCGTTPLIGVAHHQNEVGDWRTKEGWPLTWGDHWPLRRIPSATVTAEEVELPTEFGAVITDVEMDFGKTCRLDHMVWTGTRWARRYRSTTSGFIHAFTLPDGTHARRDGEHEDGTPRFVKETHNDRP